MDGSADGEETETVEPAIVATTIDDSDSEDELPEIPAFVKASQYKLPKAKVRLPVVCICPRWLALTHYSLNSWM